MTNHSRFFEYFRGTYAKRCGEWATCHRVGAIVNTNMHLESFHRLLKVVYLQGKVNRRLDHLIRIILKVSRDKGFERLQKLHEGKVSHRAYELNRRHRKAEEMQIAPTMTSATTWEVKSQSSPQTVHVVQAREDHQCVCQLTCGVCKVCTYKYSCTCGDYAVHNTACKHIHLVHMMPHSMETDQENVMLPQPSHKLNKESCAAPPVPLSRKALTPILRTPLATLDKYQQIVVNKATQVAALAKSIDDVEALKLATQHLNSAINMMKALQPTLPPQTLPCRKRPAPNTNMETQM